MCDSQVCVLESSIILDFVPNYFQLFLNCSLIKIYKSNYLNAASILQLPGFGPKWYSTQYKKFVQEFPYSWSPGPSSQGEDSWCFCIPDIAGTLVNDPLIWTYLCLHPSIVTNIGKILNQMFKIYFLN